MCIDASVLSFSFVRYINISPQRAQTLTESEGVTLNLQLANGRSSKGKKIDTKNQQKQSEAKREEQTPHRARVESAEKRPAPTRDEESAATPAFNFQQIEILSGTTGAFVSERKGGGGVKQEAG